MKNQSRILIVDDNQRNTAIVERILKDHYALTTVYTGEEALAVVDDVRPDIILLDIMLPGIDGYEVCQEVKASQKLHNVKVIMVSAKAMIDEKLRGYESGADDYVTKPFDGDELLAKVRVYLRLKTVEELDTLKSNLLTLLSHETRTPLTYLTGAAERLRSMKNMSDEHNELVTMISDGTTRIADLLEKALRYGDLKSGRTKFELKKSDLAGVVNAAVSEASANAAPRNITVTRVGVESASLLADAGLLASALRIILDNAIRFSDDNGEVRVETATSGTGVTVSVTDTGRGMPPDQLSHLLMGLSVPDVMHHGRGHGLNLAIVGCIVDAHNGKMTVSSEEGIGTRFSLHLPGEEQLVPVGSESA